MTTHHLLLNDNHSIPTIGFGVFLIPIGGPTYTAVRLALDAGYRHIDTAAAYFNEEDVGKAVRDSGIPREQLFITSKLWISDLGYAGAQRGIARSLRKFGMDYMDLYLIHQPYGDVLGAWRAMEVAREQGLIRSIGVSNMTPTIYNKFVPNFSVKPAVNQVEFNPTFLQRELRACMQKDGTVLEAWYPLGHGDAALLRSPVITDLAQKYGKNAGQIIIRFELQEGVVSLPKSVNPQRIKSNLEVFDFELSPSEMQSIRSLDTGRGKHDPDAPGMGEALSKAIVIKD